MKIQSPRFERTLVMESWAEGTKRSFIRILEPQHDAPVVDGIGFYQRRHGARKEVAPIPKQHAKIESTA